MLKRYLMVLTLILTLPALASAWTVNAKTSPLTGQGTIAPAGNKTYATGVDSGEYVVTPAPGYKVSRVTLDGVQTAPNGNGNYVALYLPTKSYRYIVAYFTANTIDITVSASAGGGVREDNFESLTKIPVGSARQFLITPNAGYTITAETAAAAGAVVTDNADGSKTAVFTNLQENKAFSVTFTQTAVFTVSAGKNVTIPAPGPDYSAVLVGSATSNQGEITYAWSGTDLTFATPNAASTVVSGISAGVKTATLTATSNGVPQTATTTVTVLDGKAYYLNQCTACHNSSTPLLVSAYTSGAHGTASGHTTGTCQRCHGTDGAIVGAAVGWTGGYTAVLGNTTVTAAIWTPNAPVVSAAGVGCIACHDTHDGLRTISTYVGGAKVAWDPNQNTKSNDQYDVCTSCHALTDNSGVVVGNYHDGGSMDVKRTISDSHFDNPATGVGLTTNVVEGYVVRSGLTNPCADCHSLHNANVDPQEAWAKSAHAGKISTKKDEAACAPSLIWWNTVKKPSDPATACTDIKSFTSGTRTTTVSVLEHYGKDPLGIALYKTTGALDDADGNAWTHYNWDQTSSRGTCQRCHTATGAANFLNSPATYDATGNGNNFSHLSSWSKTTGSPQQELLYCWGCHSDSQTGELRDPGAITEVYSGTPTVSVTYPDLDQSNVCMGCHLGREVGAVVTASTLDFSNLNFINSHYLTAGSTLFSESGYEYAGQTYSGGYHKNVGVANVFSTGTAGPCVTCHMTSAEGHSFEVVTKDANGAITAVVSTQCANCHGNLTPAALEGSKHEFHLAMEALKAALLAKGIEFKPAYPYFFIAGTANAFKNWNFTGSTTFPNLVGKGKDVMGAAFNYNLFDHDPGAYAHNRQYALKLIRDSIDFLADGAVDNQGIPAAVTAAASSKEFAAGTSHPAAIATAAANNSVTDCGICHQVAPHSGGAVFHKAQYVSTASLPVICANCHVGSDTSINADIQAQFAASGHAAAEGDAWRQYDWRSASRISCQRCHTGTGFVAKLGSESSTSNAFTASDILKPGEVLNCSSCHDNVTTGALRDVLDTFTVGSVSYNVVGASTLCARCHGGRESGNAIKSNANTTGILGFISPHYLAAAATLYGAGYEFSTSTSGPNKDLGANEQGPCVACHMAAGNHSMTAATPTDADTKKAAVAVALVSLKTALEAKGIFYSDKHPYFYTAPYAGRDSVTNEPGVNFAYTNWATPFGVSSWKDTMGAAFNYQLLLNEPGAYAHDYDYTMKLITDSIDFLGDGAVNGN